MEHSEAIRRTFYQPFSADKFPSEVLRRSSSSSSSSSSVSDPPSGHHHHSVRPIEAVPETPDTLKHKVLSIPLFTEEGIRLFLEEYTHLKEQLSDAPNPMNRSGLSVPESMYPFFQSVIDVILRPIINQHFKEYGNVLSDDFHVFVVHYAAEMDGYDKSLVRHTDDSDLTLNVNLVDSFDGGLLHFYEEGDKEAVHGHVKGQGLLHGGDLEHAADPISSGERVNLILWMATDGEEGLGKLGKKFFPEYRKWVQTNPYHGY